MPFPGLILSLSEALDHVSPSVADHPLRVAYTSTRIAKALAEVAGAVSPTVLAGH